MKNGYFHSKRESLGNLMLIAIFLFSLIQLSIGQSVEPTISVENNGVECDDCSSNCFSSEIIDQSVTGSCLTRTIKVNANHCKYDLSHFIIQVPCGVITNASNSGKWPMELNKKDPKSNIWGLKVDNIKGFGDDHRKESFTVTYTVCSDDQMCLNKLTHEAFVVVYKASTCQYFDTLTPANQIVPLLAEISSTDIMCYGTSNGTVSINVTQGNEPYAFLWNTGDTTQNLINVPEGLYYVEISDSLGQKLELSATVAQPSKIEIIGVAKPSSCLADDGSIELTVSGGVEPYNIKWNDGDSAIVKTGLAVGSYIVSVTDANGCTASKTFSVKQLSNLNVSLTGATLECHQEGQGELIAQVSGGIEPYTYSWTTGETTQNLYNLNSGRYQVTITDAVGCTTTRGGYVTIKNMTAAVVAKSPTCGDESDGSASLIISNGTAPYDILWSNGETSDVVDGLAAGYYNVAISDVNGCRYSRTVIISAPKPITLSSRILRSDCSSQSGDIILIIEGNGGSKPYTYWENNVEINDTSTLHNEGIHTITVIDANGCSVTSDINVAYPDQTFNASASVVQPSCDGTIGSVVITATGGASPYNAIWSDGYTGMQRVNVDQGNYTLEVSDAIGCTSTLNIEVLSANMPSVIIQDINQPVCDSDDHVVNASLLNVQTSEWSVISESSDWYIQEANGSSMTYHAGTGNATILLTGVSAEGCIASDTIIVSCTTDDSGNQSGDCDFLDSFQVKYIEVVARDGNCVSFKMAVTTDGKSEHELSHMVVGIDNGWVKYATNTENWKVEKNMTDPKSGVYGFKVDNISGFGQSGYDEFKVFYTICYDNKVPETFDFPVVFKASTCSSTQNITVGSNGHDDGSCIDLHIYPNPFVDHSYFEFSCKKDTHLEFQMYDLCGNKVETLFKGNVRKDEKHKCSFSGKNYKDNMFFYQIITPDEVKQGKILKRK